jgi:hypothetical protein
MEKEKTNNQLKTFKTETELKNVAEIRLHEYLFSVHTTLLRTLRHKIELRRKRLKELRTSKKTSTGNFTGRLQKIYMTHAYCHVKMYCTYRSVTNKLVIRLINTN